MLFMSVARQLGLGNFFAGLSCCPLSSEAGRKKTPSAVKLTMPLGPLAAELRRAIADI
jgi:hypothetical protein